MKNYLRLFKRYSETVVTVQISASNDYFCGSYSKKKEQKKISCYGLWTGANLTTSKFIRAPLH